MVYHIICIKILCNLENWLCTTMTSFPIMVLHSGHWDDAKWYIDYVLEGIISGENSTYLELYTLIA